MLRAATVSVRGGSGLLRARTGLDQPDFPQPPAWFAESARLLQTRERRLDVLVGVARLVLEIVEPRVAKRQPPLRVQRWPRRVKVKT
jgi:hypothetical protein